MLSPRLGSGLGISESLFHQFLVERAHRFAPWPQQSTDLDTIQVDYDVSPNDLVNGTDYPFNNINEFIDYQHALAYWASATIEQIDQQPGLSGYYLTLYQAMATQWAKHARDLQNYLPGPQVLRNGPYFDV